MTPSLPPAAVRAALLVERLGRLLAGREHGAGLNPSQWEALRYLARANRFSRTPGALALYLGATKGTVSQSVAALRRKGLVRGERSASDRRSVALSLTDAGRRLMERDPLAELSAAAGALGPQEGEALARALATLLGGLQRRNGLRPFGLCRDCRHFGADEAVDRRRARHRCRLLAVDLAEAEPEQLCSEQEAA